VADEQRAGWAEGVATHRLIDGRRWRVSDPRIPEDLRAALVRELMSARRAVGAASGAEEERTARGRVHDAKVALGERGLRWWLDELTEEEVADRVRRTARALHRAARLEDPAAPHPSDAHVAAAVSCPVETVESCAVVDQAATPGRADADRQGGCPRCPAGEA
jgi:hypothetical protein